MYIKLKSCQNLSMSLKEKLKKINNVYNELEKLKQGDYFWDKPCSKSLELAQICIEILNDIDSEKIHTIDTKVLKKKLEEEKSDIFVKLKNHIDSLKDVKGYSDIRLEFHLEKIKQLSLMHFYKCVINNKNKRLEEGINQFIKEHESRLLNNKY